MACKRCGQCCTRMTFIMGGMKIDGGPDVESFVRYVRAHRVDTRWIKTSEEGTPVLAVQVPLNCTHLIHDEQTGLCSCAIYEDRPEICRQYLCPAARED